MRAGRAWSRTPISSADVVGARGFEPPTLCSQSRCATRLRYTPRTSAGLRYKRFPLSATEAALLDLLKQGRPHAHADALLRTLARARWLPHIALFEVGAPFEGYGLSFQRNENKTPDYLAINPLGQVPTLVVDGRPLTEVAGILFLSREGLSARRAWRLPDDAEGQAQVISWMSFIAATVHPARRQGLDHARKIYALADQRLGPRDWAVGDSYSIADIHLFRLFLAGLVWPG